MNTTRSPLSLVLCGSLLIACSGGLNGPKQPAGPLGDSGTPDAGQPPAPKLGSRFDTAPVAWGLPQGGFKVEGFNTISQQFGREQISDQYWVLRDMNGDGVPDLVVTTVIRDVQGTTSPDQTYDEPFGYPSSSHWLVYLGGNGGFNNTPLAWPVPTGGRLNRGFNREHNQEDPADDIRNDFWGGTLNDHGDEAWMLTDIDGDGKPDLVVTGVANAQTVRGWVFQVFGPTSAPYWKVFKNSGSGFAATATNFTVPLHPAWDTFGGLATGSSSGIYAFRSNRWAMFDIDGDGKPDLVSYAKIQTVANVEVAQVEGFPSAPHWLVYKNTGSGFAQTPVSWAVPLQRGTTKYGLNSLAGVGAQAGENSWTLMDMDGDHKLDLVVTATLTGGVMKAQGFPGDSHWEVYRNTGTGFGPIQQWALPRGGSGQAGYPSMSFSPSVLQGDTAWSTQDLDGDGIPDLVVTAQLDPVVGLFQFGRQSDDSQWEVFRGTGTAFVAQSTKWVTPSGGNHQDGYNHLSGTGASIGDESWSLVDLDGDGHPELCITGDSVDDPNNPGFGFTVNLMPGFGTSPHWRVYRNLP